MPLESRRMRTVASRRPGRSRRPPLPESSTLQLIDDKPIVIVDIRQRCTGHEGDSLVQGTGSWLRVAEASST